MREENVLQIAALKDAIDSTNLGEREEWRKRQKEREEWREREKRRERKRRMERLTCIQSKSHKEQYALKRGS